LPVSMDYTFGIAPSVFSNNCLLYLSKPMLKLFYRN
jgi:hypothetical protein